MTVNVNVFVTYAGECLHAEDTSSNATKERHLLFHRITRLMVKLTIIRARGEWVRERERESIR